MVRRIMVPLDGSRFAECALPFALSVSRRTEAPIHLVTIQEPIPSFAYDEWETAAEEWSTQYLQNVLERTAALAGGEVTTSLLSGHVVEVLDKEAEARSVDLVVMATHGRGMLSRAWLGSVADAFVHHTNRPVLLVRPEQEEKVKLEEEPEISRILVPLDGSELSETVLEDAVELGALFGAAYHLTRVVPYPMEFSSPYLPHTMQMNQQFVTEAKESAEAYLDGHAERLRKRGYTVDTGVVVVAQPGHGILAESEQAEADFIAMATHGRTGLSRAILGSTADKVLRGTHLPLLLHRPTHEDR